MATTLATLRDRVEAALQDDTNAIWATADIDEAIRQALAEFSRVLPARAIVSVTLAAAGREVDVSSITGYIDIVRVWWDYDSTDPAHPPHWRTFELWPGDIVYINDDDEPAIADVVRIWYTYPHTIEDLDSATATTLAPADDTTILQGAAATACMMRAREISEDLTVDGWPHRRLLETAADYKAKFDAGIMRAIRREASRWSGVSPSSALDRWDEVDDW